MKVLSFLVFILVAAGTIAQVSLSTINSPYTQDFNTLANTGTSSTLPTGWFFNETGTGANTTYAAGTGSDNTGNTYSFGSTSNSERALGGLRSGSVIATIGASFTNNTGATITSLDISYFGEQWRLGATGRVDRIDFQYSLNATSLTSGTWIDVNPLDFTAPTTSGTTGALDGNATANRTSISSSITSLSIAAGATFWIRWTDFDASGADDGLGVDDFSITPQSSITNTITISNLSSLIFSVDCSTGANGSIDFNSTGSFIVGNTFTAQLSNAAGSFASPTNLSGSVSASGTDPSGTINFQIPPGTATGSGYRIRVVSSNPAATSLDNGSDLTITLNICSISSANVTGSPFNVDCTNNTSVSGTVDFTSIGTFDPTNNYIVQLSDATGSFTSPIQIGISSGDNSNSGTLSFTIPSTLPSGSAYRIRIVSTNPSITGSNNGIDLTVNQALPCTPSLPAQGLIINEWSNGPSSEKEYYEFVVAGQCGDLVDIRGYILDDNNATFTNPADYDAVASGIAPGHFRFSNSALWSNIPVGSLIVIYNANDPNPLLPPDDLNDANNDSLYVIPHTSTLFERCGTMPTSIEPDSIYTPCTYSTSVITGWAALSLRNAGDAIQVRNPNGSYYFGVSYGGSEMTGGPHNLKLFNGSGSTMCGWFNSGDLFDISNWSSGTVAGNETPGLPNNAANLAWLRLMRNPNSAICPITVLPSTTVNFKAFNEQGKNLLYWQTQSEQNNDYFTLFHSTDGVNYQEIGKVQGAGNSNSMINYSFVHNRPPRGINYYKLSSTDYDGTTYNKGIAAVMVEGEGTYFDPYTSQLKFSEKSEYAVYSTDGKLLGSVNNEDSMDFQHHGMILIQDLRTLSIERLFIP